MITIMGSHLRGNDSVWVIFTQTGTASLLLHLNPRRLNQLDVLRDFIGFSSYVSIELCHVCARQAITHYTVGYEAEIHQ